MDDFKKSEVGTFEEELQALIDYGHDCCARIDDKIHECCERIKKAHDAEVGSYAIALGWKQEQDQFATTYDVLGNERHKAICELRKFEPMMGGRPTEEASKLIRCITGKSDSHVACANDLEETRDRLIHLLGGDTVEVEDGMDAGRCGETSAGGVVPAADKRRADCDDDLPSEGVERITQELRKFLHDENENADENWLTFDATWGSINRLFDAIDAIHANLERENEELRQRTMYPAESERVNMLEREVKRLTAECKTQRNNFDQATSAREHWKSLYEQALEHIHDLERDYEVACHVNEKQERDYLEWCDESRRMQKEIDDLKAKNGDMWLKGYHECHEELMEGNATLAADLEKVGWMMLPKDVDDELIHIGDVMGDRSFPDAKYTVVGIGEDTFFTRDASGGLYKHIASLYIHYHAPTVEDVLREMLDAWGELPSDATNEAIVAEYAAKLRLAEEADE